MGRQAQIDERDLERRLAGYLAGQRGDDRPVTVERRLSGGWSVDTFKVLLGDEELVLRLAGPEHPLRTNAAREGRAMERAGRAGVPVPRVYCTEDDPAWLDRPFALVSFIEGSAPNVWSRRNMAALLEGTTAEDLLGQVLDMALAVQRVPVDEGTAEPPSILGFKAGDYSISAEAAMWLELLDRCEHPRPALRLAGAWLRDNPPPAGEVVFQHHDFRLGNIMFGPGGQARAVLDWEFSGAGDPLCDLGYAAQPYCLGRLLRSEPSLELEPDPTTWMLAAYSDRVGGVDEDRMRWFLALGIFKMAVALAIPADTWQGGRGDPRDGWLELPILTLEGDLLDTIGGLG